MYESSSANQQNVPALAIDPVVKKAAEHFAKMAKYEPPKVATFPLHGLGGSGITSLTGNT
ncbi:MAG: hypothetical protein K2Z80_04170 [Xanthobacteraceae bacterium]|nr:hypothetical protein [Xanthobacteraceae bacterium]